jgi:hypothetical protein
MELAFVAKSVNHFNIDWTKGVEYLLSEHGSYQPTESIAKARFKSRVQYE